ncbi:MAG: sn-glycerol-3-phosphate ABC transporter ATP-binding protein UgpC [Pseudomonadota bacterium]
MAEIELQNLTKRFAGISAVKQASFTIHDGEFFILVGPSGCGKSTLLNMIVGLEEISEGEIRVDGVRVNDLDPKDRNMAMVFQSYALYPHMSVRENVSFPLKLAKLPKEEIDKRVARAAEILELEDLLDRRPRALSGGQRQRVAMGRAIVREPKVFLLDEPLSNLDAKLRVQMRTEIARLQRRLGTTTLFVTHDQTEAMTLGDRIAVLRKGEVLQIGTPRELYEYPRNLFVAGFIGSPAMNFLPVRWSEGNLEIPIGSLAPSADIGRRVEAAEGSLVAGFRPEHLHVVGEKDEAREGLCFEVQVEVVEWLGADLFVYFNVALDGFEELALPEDLDIESGDGAHPILVARLDPTAGLRVGDKVRLHLAAEHLQLFGAASGENLTLSD